MLSLISYSSLLTAKPIDLLARYVSAEEDDLAVEMHEPYTYLNVRPLVIPTAPELMHGGRD